MELLGRKTIPFSYCFAVVMGFAAAFVSPACGLYDVVVVGGGPAGVVAALAASRRCDPREVPLGDIKAKLSEIGHIVPSHGRKRLP